MIPVPVSVQTTSTKFGCVIKNAAYAQSCPRGPAVSSHSCRGTGQTRPLTGPGIGSWRHSSRVEVVGRGSQLRSIPQLPHLTLLFSWTTGPHNTVTHSFSGSPPPHTPPKQPRYQWRNPSVAWKCRSGCVNGQRAGDCSSCRVVRLDTASEGMWVKKKGARSDPQPRLQFLNFFFNPGESFH